MKSSTIVVEKGSAATTSSDVADSEAVRGTIDGNNNSNNDDTKQRSTDLMNTEKNDDINAVIDKFLTGEERAERGLISSIEARKSRVRTATGDYWVVAADGERPPLGNNLPFEGFYEQVVTNYPRRDEKSQPLLSKATHFSPTGGPIATRPTFNRSVTTGRLHGAPQKVLIRSSNNKDAVHKLNETKKQASFRRHRRSGSRAQAFLDSIQPTSTAASSSTTKFNAGHNIDKDSNNRSGQKNKHEKSASVGITGSDQLLEHTLLEEQQQQRRHQQVDEQNVPSGLPPRTNKKVETTPQKESNNGNHHENAGFSPLTPDIESGENTPLLSSSPSPSEYDFGDNNHKPPFNSSYNSLDDATETTPSDVYLMKRCKRSKKGIQETCSRYFYNPRSLVLLMYRSIQKMHFLIASIPLFVISLLLYYLLGNPKFSFLPGVATIAWWINFFGRQCITLEIARFVQWIVIDYIVLQTKIAVTYLGPFITFLLIQSRGWPFIVCTWSILDLLLLHGDTPFQLHWLYFTNISFYNEANSGSYVLVSGLYFRFLISMLISGFACTIEGSMVSVFFGRRTFSMFKERLENILKEVIIISEVAELAAEAGRLSTAEAGEVPIRGHSPKLNLLGAEYNWAQGKLSSTDDGMSGAFNVDDDEGAGITEDLNEYDCSEYDATECQESSCRNHRLKELLEKWEEPMNKMDKSMNTSIRDILKFRRALVFIDDPNLFGEAFGAASSRDHVLHSAEIVYRNLLTFCPDRENLLHQVFEMVVDEDDEERVNDAKRNVLKKMFRPDANRELSLFAFLQSCDAVYKKLRFFRASVGNASVIDRALEGIFNGFFYFLLVLTVLSIMRINPWPLLVSLSTILVSASFAVGSSASKYIEGVLLVAVRRPYDLGDRVYMIDPSNINGDEIAMSWFIEDINLSYTTVRYASTNEVATLSNGSIAGLRIVNANRSPNAIIKFQLPFHISVASENKEKLTILRSALEQYAKDYPNHWKCFLFCRVSELHVELEQAILIFGLQHRSSWQDFGRIMLAKAELICYVYELSKNLGVAYDVIPKEVLYYAGLLKAKGEKAAITESV